MTTNYFQALNRSGINYLKIKGKNFKERYKPLFDYFKLRYRFNLQPYANKVLNEPVAPLVYAEVFNRKSVQYLNFSSQDYLGLAQNETVKNAAKKAIDDFGFHTAASPVLSGRNKLTEKLEEKLAGILNKEHCILFPTGWGACFGVISALITENDFLIIDALSHNSLQVAARYATPHIQKFKHNDLDHLNKLLSNCRLKDSNAGLFVVLEGLYSMNSDMPDLKNALKLVEKYQAILILDVAHDFGAMGKKGLGILETVDKSELENVVLCGSFSKSFATNGGFIASSALLRPQFITFSPSYTFSNGISPVQCGIVLLTADIIFSKEGDILRRELNENINFAIEEFKRTGFETIGIPSPIVPVLIGEEEIARLMSKEIVNKKLLANLAEFPGVPKGKSIFRFQLMSNHTKPQITEAVKILEGSRQDANDALKNLKENNYVLSGRK